jgi:hypothetical protein
MSGHAPSFLTGANAKIKIGPSTIGYAQDCSYRVTVSQIPIEVMGKYEVVAYEPIAYSVEGTLSVIRYTSAAAGVAGANAEGNGVGNWDVTPDQKGNFAFDPSKLMVSKTFDLEVFQKINPNGDVGENGVIKLTDCRFTSKGGSINRRGVLVEQFAFNAILASDDSFKSSPSSANTQDLKP